uniref:Uncharacterized protein n=1 Tax=viral metagenome TaxID=1070528 RepID=A0A6C0D4E1_9ZZZZ
MTLFEYPIYSGDSIFGKLKKTQGTCPAKTDICNNFPNSFYVIDGTVSLPLCSSASFRFTENKEESPSGCCVVDTSYDTCDSMLEAKGVTNTAGKYYDMGIDITDASGENQRSICHSAPIRKRTLVITDFITIIIASAVILILTAIVGGCYEFILKYGECKDCIYYKSTCTNRKRLSVIEYMFPSVVCNYPYQECNKGAGTGTGESTLTGGGPEKSGFISTYAEYTANGTKCITLHEVESKQTKPFPYNLIDYANDSIKLELIRIPMRAFALFFLYTALFTRQILSYILKKCSIKYQQVVKNNAVVSNIMFLFLTGILFNIIAKYTGITGLHGANGYILYFLIMVSSVMFSLSCVAAIFVLWWYPSLVFEKYYIQCNIPRNYYKMVNIRKMFYSLTDKKRPLSRRILFIIIDILLLIPLIIVAMMSLCFGVFGSTIAFLYIVVSLLFNMFYIPLSNTVEFLDIIKSHGNLLTILFCVTVLVASINKMNAVTSGILGGLMAFIILYTLIRNAK